MTDDKLIYFIDYDFFTIRELEKEVGAGVVHPGTVHFLSEIIKNCLQEVLNEGMINPQASTPDNEENMRKSQKDASHCQTEV